jgi:hypothetical protein
VVLSLIALLGACFSRQSYIISQRIHQHKKRIANQQEKSIAAKSKLGPIDDSVEHLSSYCLLWTTAGSDVGMSLPWPAWFPV